MGKFKNLRDAHKEFENNGGSGERNDFFTLKDDKETAVVRFLHEGEEDLDWYIVHEAQIEGKKRYVKCTEESDCPLCKVNNKPKLKLFLQLADKRDGKVKTWERGQKFVPTVLSFINRYGTMCGQPVEIERQGRKGDTNTQYLMYPLDRDNKNLSELPKRQQLLGENGFVLDKSKEDMQRIADGTFRYEPVEGGRDNTQSRREEPRREETRQQEPQKREDSGDGSDIF